MALIGLVYKIMPHSSMGLAKIMSLAIIPVFLISPLAGVYVDRWSRQKTMCVSDLLRGIFIMFIPAFAFNFKSLVMVYILIFLSFCVGRFFIPAKMAILPALIEENQVLMANSLVSITAMIAAILGLGLGGVIVEKWGVKNAFMIDAFTFFISALSIFLMRIKEEEGGGFSPIDVLNLGKEAITKVKNSFFREMKEGLRYLVCSEQTWFAAKVFSILFSCLGALYVVFIVFIQETLGSVTMDLGWLAVGGGLGLFLGSLVYGRAGRDWPIKRVINLSLVFASLYLVFFVSYLKYYPSKSFALLSCFLLGIGVSPLVIGVNTLVHKGSGNNFWGRIFSSLEVVIHLGFIGFMFIASYLADKFSPFTIILSAGIIISFFSLFNLLKDND